MANLVRTAKQLDSSSLFRANDRDLLSPIGKQFPKLYFVWGIPGQTQTANTIYAVRFNGGKGEYKEVALVVGNTYTVLPFLDRLEVLFGDNLQTGLKSLERYFKQFGNLDRLSDGRIPPVEFAQSIADNAIAAGYSQDSVTGFISALMSSEALFFGAQVTKYYELPSLRKELPGSAEPVDNAQSEQSEVIEVSSTTVVGTKEQKSLSVDQLLELDRNSLSKDSIIRILSEYGTEFDPKADKSTLLKLLG